MNQIFNKKAQKGIRQALRRALPPGEIILWSRLRSRQMYDQKFRRQFSVGPYVIDFYWPALKLAIEVDGDSHFRSGQQRRDKRRQAYIESIGIAFLRFRNNEVRENLAGVPESIYRRVVELEAGMALSVTRGDWTPCRSKRGVPLAKGDKVEAGALGARR